MFNFNMIFFITKYIMENVFDIFSEFVCTKLFMIECSNFVLLLMAVSKSEAEAESSTNKIALYNLRVTGVIYVYTIKTGPNMGFLWHPCCFKCLTGYQLHRLFLLKPWGVNVTNCNEIGLCAFWYRSFDQIFWTG